MCLVLQFFSVTATGLPFSDDFEREDTQAGDGLGNGWLLTGSGSDVVTIASGRMVTVNASGPIYAYRYFTQKPTEVGCSFSWTATGEGSGEQALAVLLSPFSALVMDCIHLVLTPTTWSIQVREAGGDFIVLDSGVLATATDGSVVSMWARISETTLTLRTPDAAEHVVTDSRIASLHGPYAVWEIGNNTVARKYELRIESVYANA